MYEIVKVRIERLRKHGFGSGRCTRLKQVGPGTCHPNALFHGTLTGQAGSEFNTPPREVKTTPIAIHVGMCVKKQRLEAVNGVNCSA